MSTVNTCRPRWPLYCCPSAGVVSGPMQDGASGMAASAATGDESACGYGGTITRIEVKNFMCHEHLIVDLVHGLNFVTGANGSGKSAVLTALTVCLGARASTTQRGASLDGLIKEGCTTAEVAVTIDNSGGPATAYRYSEYGTLIVVERVLRRDGQHAFRIRNGTSNKIVECKRDEVTCICDHYALLVDNPLVVLTQETSKKFLVNSTPKDLYSVHPLLLLIVVF